MRSARASVNTVLMSAHAERHFLRRPFQTRTLFPFQKPVDRQEQDRRKKGEKNDREDNDGQVGRHVFRETGKVNSANTYSGYARR